MRSHLCTIVHASARTHTHLDQCAGRKVCFCWNDYGSHSVSFYGEACCENVKGILEGVWVGGRWREPVNLGTRHADAKMRGMFASPAC